MLKRGLDALSVSLAVASLLILMLPASLAALQSDRSASGLSKSYSVVIGTVSVAVAASALAPESTVSLVFVGVAVVMVGVVGRGLSRLISRVIRSVFTRGDQS